MYKKLTLLFILFTIHIFQCFGQKESIIDSLLSKLSYAKIDTVKANILADLVFEYLSYDIKKAEEYGKTSLEFSQKIKYSYGIALSFRNISYISIIKSDYRSALSYALKSLKEAQKINNLVVIASSLGIIGNIYFAQKEYKKALKYYLESLKNAQLSKDNDTIIISFNQMGRFHLAQEDYTEAISFFNQAIVLAKQSKKKNRESDYLFYLGKTYYMKKEYKRALFYLYQCLQIDKKVEDKMSITMTFKEIAKAHYGLKQIDSAIIYNKYAIKYSFLINSKGETQQIYETMYLIYKEKKDLKNALYYHEQMIILKDSIYTKDKINAIANLQANYEIKEKQAEIEKQNIIIQLNQKKIKEQHIIRNIFIIGFILTAFLGYIFYKSYQKIQNANNIATLQNKIIKEQKESLQAINEELSQQNEEIQLLNGNLEKIVSDRTIELKSTIENLSKQNQDLEQFSYIISHNLRAPVARILGLVSIFNKKELVSLDNQEVFDYLKKATQSLDEVIKDLTQIISIRKNLTSIKEQVSFKDELNTVLSYFTTQIKENDIKIQYTFQEEHLNSIKSYIQSILFNFISNTIKYKSDKRALIVNIKTELANNFICLSIQDNGIGIDLTNTDTYKIFGLYQRMHDHVEGKGLGLYLVKTQIEFLNGTVSIDSKLDVGTTFKAYFPV